MKVSCAIIEVLKLFKSDHTQTQLCNIYKAKARVISNEGLFVTDMSHPRLSFLQEKRE